jgi:hypothetical protein
MQTNDLDYFHEHHTELLRAAHTARLLHGLPSGEVSPLAPRWLRSVRRHFASLAARLHTPTFSGEPVFGPTVDLG